VLLCAWFVDLGLRGAVLETWSLTRSVGVYVLAGDAASGAANFRPAWDFAGVDTLDLVPLTGESRFPKEQSLYFYLA